MGAGQASTVVDGVVILVSIVVVIVVVTAFAVLVLVMVLVPAVTSCVVDDRRPINWVDVEVTVVCLVTVVVGVGMLRQEQAVETLEGA